MKRTNIIDLSEYFNEFRKNKLRWTVVAKEYFTFTIYLRCKEHKCRIRVYKKPGKVVALRTIIPL